MKIPSSHQSAIAYSLAAYTIWVLGDVCTKIAGKAEVPPSQIIAVSSFFCCFALFAFCAFRGELKNLLPKQWKIELGRSLLFVFLSFANVFSFTHFAMATVYTVLFSMPLWAAIGAAIFMREPLPLRLVLSILLGFVGVIIAISNSKIGFDGKPILHLAVLILFPVMSSVNVLLIRFLGRKEYAESLAFFPHFVRAFIVLLLFSWQFEPLSLKLTLCLAGLGFSAAFGTLLFTASLKKAPAAIISPFIYTQIISGAFFGYLFWNEIPSPQILIGSIIIITASYYITNYAKKIPSATSI